MRDPDPITFYNKSFRNLCGPYYRDVEKALTPSKLRIVADENIPALEALFADIGEIKTYPGRHITHSDLVEADVLLVRSITQVTAELVANTPMQFVGTATIGTDHIDEAALKALGIGFSSAPGCNADAVVEYVLSCLLHLAAEQSFSLHEKTIGIIGVGQVGGRLASRLRALGLSPLLSDPPRQKREEGETFVSLDELLASSDIICCHTPLTQTGDDPTWHLLNEQTLQRIRAGSILLNAGRGPVIDQQALLARMKGANDLTLVLDVWEHEPVVLADLAAYVRIATPHIAGYSLDGKIRGTWMLRNALANALGFSPPLPLEHYLPVADARELKLEAQADVLLPVRLLYDPYRDDRALRQTLLLEASEQAIAFDQLRKLYPVRREFSTLTLVVSSPVQATYLESLGFRVALE